MPVTQVSICNSALIKIGADIISSITQDCRAANLLNALWDQERDCVLRAHPWNFAIKRATLSPTSDAPDSEYDYEYDIPNDCLRVLTTYPDSVDFVVEDSKILSDDDELSVIYIYRNENMSSWDACFAEAFAWKLAKECAYALTQSAALISVCEDGYRKALAEARSMDGAEGVLKRLEADEWILARR